MINRLLCIVGFCLLALNTVAHKRVFIPFFVDGFKAPDKTWPAIETSEVYSNDDNGAYCLLMDYWPNNVEQFYLKPALRIAPGLKKKQSTGIAITASKSVGNVLIIDINRFRDYRIRRAHKGKYICGLLEKHWINYLLEPLFRREFRLNKLKNKTNVSS
ncbi:MAG: hypothetical protein ACI8P7_001084 [Candidatus Azotimanducaceae bacterium]|jgi:hypothetical protein